MRACVKKKAVCCAPSFFGMGRNLAGVFLVETGAGDDPTKQRRDEGTEARDGQRVTRMHCKQLCRRRNMIGLQQSSVPEQAITKEQSPTTVESAGAAAAEFFLIFEYAV